MKVFVEKRRRFALRTHRSCIDSLDELYPAVTSSSAEVQDLLFVGGARVEALMSVAVLTYLAPTL